MVTAAANVHRALTVCQVLLWALYTNEPFYLDNASYDFLLLFFIL